MVVQTNGKLRGRILVDVSITEEEAVDLALASPLSRILPAEDLRPVVVRVPNLVLTSSAERGAERPPPPVPMTEAHGGLGDARRRTRDRWARGSL